MKRTLLGLLAIAAVGSAVAGTFLGHHAHSRAADLARIQLNPLPSAGADVAVKSLKLTLKDTRMPSDEMVYRVVRPKVTDAGVEAEAKRYGVQGKAEKHGDLTVVKGNGSDIVMDNETGSLNWLTDEYETAATPITDRLSDAEYEAKAKEFLASKGHKVDSLIFTGTSEYTADGRPVMVEAHFGRQLNGAKWQGVGPKKTVVFGEGARIIGMFSVWREVEPVRKYPLMRPDEAAKQVLTGEAMVVTDESNIEAVAESVELVYFSDALGSGQRFVAPHYLFKGKTSSGRDFSAIVRAIPPSLVDDKRADNVSPASVGRTQ